MSISLILLFISLFTWGVGEGMFIYFQPIYLQQLGASMLIIASVFSIYGAAMMIAHVPAGLLADRFGRKPLLIVSWVVGMLAAFVMALARSLPVFVTGMLLYGMTNFVASPLNSYVTAARGRLSPARAMTFSSAAYNLGGVIGPVAGGWIGDRLGLREVYPIAACVLLVSTLILLLIRSQPTEAPDPNQPSANIITNTRLIRFVGIAFLAMFVMYVPQPLTPNFLQDQRHLSLSTIGWLGAASSLGNVVLNIVLGQFAARTGFLLAQVSVALFSLLLWRGSGVPWYALGYFLLGGYRASRPLISAQVRTLVQPAQMGLAYGIAETFNSLGAVLAPLLAGVVYTRGPVLVYPVSLVLGAVALLVSGLLAPREADGSPLPGIIHA